MGGAVGVPEKEVTDQGEPELSKEEIKELYAHLSQEYSRKVSLLISEREKRSSEETPPQLDALSDDSSSDEEDEDDDDEEGKVDQDEVNHDDDDTKDGVEQKEAEEGDATEPPSEDASTKVEEPKEEAEAEAETKPKKTDEQQEGVEKSVDKEVAEEQAERDHLEEIVSPGGTRKCKMYSGDHVQRKLIEIVLEDKPQLLNMKVKVRVNNKALDLLGDDVLDEQRRKYIAAGIKITPKVLARLGDVHIVPDKANKLLGDLEMSKEQRKKMIKAEEDEKRSKEKQKEKEFQEVLNARPSQNAVKVPSDTRVATKAIDILGGTEDEQLMTNVRTQITEDMRKAKTYKITGESAMLPDKVLKRRGSEMHDSQKKMMKKMEEAERRHKEKQERRSRQQSSSKSVN